MLQGIGPLGTQVCHEGCSVMECAGKQGEIPNFDMKAKTRSGQRIWINMSTVIFDNQRTGERLLIHLAHEITEQKKSEELVHKILDLSRQLGQPVVKLALYPMVHPTYCSYCAERAE